MDNRFYSFYKLIKNSGKCTKCDTVLESKHRHDFVTCKCGNISIDGGPEYSRRVGGLSDYEDLCEYRKYTKEELLNVIQTYPDYLKPSKELAIEALFEWYGV